MIDLQLCRGADSLAERELLSAVFVKLTSSKEHQGALWLQERPPSSGIDTVASNLWASACYLYKMYYFFFFFKRRHILQIKETADIKNSNQWLEKADLEHSTEALITTASLKAPDA